MIAIGVVICFAMMEDGSMALPLLEMPTLLGYNTFSIT
jgi:hypothetical protein